MLEAIGDIVLEVVGDTVLEAIGDTVLDLGDRVSEDLALGEEGLARLP